MTVKVTWINGSETELEVHSLRDLDAFLGNHTSASILADLKPDQRGLRLIFTEAMPAR